MWAAVLALQVACIHKLTAQLLENPGPQQISGMCEASKRVYPAKLLHLILCELHVCMLLCILCLLKLLCTPLLLLLLLHSQGCSDARVCFAEICVAGINRQAGFAGLQRLLQSS
jgi:hypothetical protein